MEGRARRGRGQPPSLLQRRRGSGRLSLLVMEAWLYNHRPLPSWPNTPLDRVEGIRAPDPRPSLFAKPPSIPPLGQGPAWTHTRRIHLAGSRLPTWSGSPSDPLPDRGRGCGGIIIREREGTPLGSPPLGPEADTSGTPPPPPPSRAARSSQGPQPTGQPKGGIQSRRRRNGAAYKRRIIAGDLRAWAAAGSQ